MKTFWRRLFFIIGFILLVFTCLVLLPSFMSMKGHYSTKPLSEKFEGYYDPNTDEIVVFAENGTFWYDIIYEHELCHRNQHYRNSSLNLFLSEVECYIKQWRGLR